MSDKKHIDRLFQESFKDFEAAPNDAVWENIEAQLKQKKKKRRVIAIWWRYAGVAAILLLLLTIGLNYFNDSDDNTQTNQIVDTEKESSETESNNSIDKNTLNKSGSPTQNDVTESDEAIANTNLEKNINEDSSNHVTNETETINNKIKPSKGLNNIAGTSSLPLQNTNKQNKTGSLSSSDKKQNTLNTLNKKDNTVIMASNPKGSPNKATLNGEGKLIDKKKTKAIINTPKNNTVIAKNETAKDQEKNETIIDQKTENNNLSIEDAIDKTKDIIEEEEEKLNRWSIAPNAAPVYFNSLGKGSSIDPQFNNNSKSGELNMSYGISASYAVNKKLTIRSGVNKVNLGYNTNNVVVFQSVGFSSSSRALQNVDVGTNDNTIAGALTSGNTETISIISGESLNAKSSPESLATNTSINQSLGYIEVPLEIQYTLSNKKLGVNVIGGFSSFFLNNNEVFSEADNGTRSFLGEANNINKVSYSANLGFGINYQVSKKIDLNLEPMFKYQINTFNNTSGDFQPFFIGVYTGFAIKF